MKCSTCPRDTLAGDSHHVVPISYGGKQGGLQVPLCGDCHKTVHRYIENDSLVPLPQFTKLVEVGRRAKRMHKAGQLEARDRRPTLLVPTTPDDEALIKFVSSRLNVKGRAATMLAALRFTAATLSGRNVLKK